MIRWVTLRSVRLRGHRDERAARSGAAASVTSSNTIIGVREVIAYGHAADELELACIAKVAFDGATDAEAESFSFHRWTMIPPDGDEPTRHYLQALATYRVQR